MTKKQNTSNFTKFFLIPFFGILLITFIYNLIPSEKVPPIYRITFDKTWYPLHLFDLGPDISILSEELTRAIAKEENLPIQLYSVPSDDLFSGLDSDTYTGVLSSALAIDADDDRYLQSEIYYPLGPVLVVSSQSDIKGIEDIGGKSIGVISESKPVISLFKNSSINMVFYDYNDLTRLIDDVSNNRIDGMILNMIPAYEFAHSSIYHQQIKIVSEPLTNVGLRLIALKSNPDGQKLITYFNEGLNKLKKNGVYGRLLNELGLFNPDKIEDQAK